MSANLFHFLSTSVVYRSPNKGVEARVFNYLSVFRAQPLGRSFSLTPLHVKSKFKACPPDKNCIGGCPHPHNKHQDLSVLAILVFGILP